MSKKHDKFRWREEWEDNGVDVVESGDADFGKMDSEALRRRVSHSVVMGRGLLANALESSEDVAATQNGSKHPKNDSLEKAISRGSFAKVQRVVRAGADLERLGSNDMTPLMMAVDKGDVKLARYLVKSGAKVNAEGVAGSTALAIAIINGDKGLVTELISLGADVNQVNEADETPLMEALYSDVAPETLFYIVDLLLKCGANPDHKSEETDKTPRQLALDSKKSEIIWLFKRKANVKSISKKPHDVGMLKSATRDEGKKLIN